MIQGDKKSMRGMMRYGRWKKSMITRAYEGCDIIETPVGPIQYADSGRPKPPVLVISPGGANFHRMFADISKEDYRVITFGRPGAYGTPITVGRSIEAQADAAAILLETLGIEKAAVVGVSGSGPTVLQFVLRHPEKTRCLVMLVGITKKWSQESWSSKFERMLIKDFPMYIFYLFSCLVGWKRFLKSYLKQFGCDPKVALGTEEGVQILIDYVLMASPPSLLKPLIDADFELHPELPDYPLEQIDVPTIAFYCPSDTVVPFEHGLNLRDRIKNIEFHSIEHGGHFINMDRDQLRIRELIAHFLKKNM
jgi:pimeloyl-ACP methyl ester carboxylesterase